MPDAFEELAGRIGRDTAETLRAEGWQPPPPKKPEPVRIVTMEESRAAHRIYRTRCGYVNPTPEVNRQTLDNFNFADDWLVKTVNRRLIERLPRVGGFGDFAWMAAQDRLYCFHVPSALLVFCGEGA